MSERKKLLLSRLEMVLAAIFLFSFLIWATSKCNTTRARYQEKAALDAEEQRITDSLNQNAVDLAAEKTVRDSLKAETPRIIKEAFTPLYVTIDGLNLRQDPNLDSKIIARLSLFEEVIFLNEVTDFKQEINLGQETANEPWVKVQSKKGKVGWVYGAGVHYYKVKREGVQ